MHASSRGRIGVMMWVVAGLLALAAAVGMVVVVRGHMRTEAFWEAINADDVGGVRELVKRSPWLVRKEDRWGSTGLCRAAEHTNVEMVRALLGLGADPDHLAVRTGTPLQEAAFFGKVEVVRELLAGGATVDLQPASATHSGAALHHAAAGGKARVVELLIAHGTDVNARVLGGNRAGSTPLHRAMSKEPQYGNRRGAIELLLRHGADVNAVDGGGNTPAELARERQLNEGIIELLEKWEGGSK